MISRANIQQIRLSSRLSVLILIVVFVLGAMAQVLTPRPVSAWGCDDAGREARADFYARNNIPSFNDPCAGACSGGGGGSITGSAPTELKGEDPAEKVWNYLTGRGLSPVAAAGAMGNIEHESGFNPWIGEGGSTSIDPTELGVGIGLIQWTNTGGNTQGRRYGVVKAMEAAGINLASVDQNDQTQTDTALLVQLNWLWDGEYGKMTWAEEVNTETTVEGDTTIASYNRDFSGKLADSQAGNGSTMQFHALVERSGDVPTQADKDNADPPGKYRNNGVLTNRIEGAKAWLEKFGGGLGGECSGGGTTDIVEMAKKVKDGAVGLQVMSGLKRGIRGLDCGDCVAFVTTVYAAAGYPKPFNGDYNDEDSGIQGPEAGPGNGSNLPKSGYVYDPTNYEIIDNSQKQPGDILAWSTHVAIYAGGDNAYEGGGGEGSNPQNYCNIGGTAWYSVHDAEVLRYKGEPVR